MIRRLLNLFLSKRCFICGTELPLHTKEECCDACRPFLELCVIRDKKCEKCGRGLSYMYHNTVCHSCQQHQLHFDGAVSAFHYDGHIKDAIHRLKFKNKAYLAATFARHVHNVLPRTSRYDYIVYPPINLKTFYKRGFNQAELIARELSSSTDIPVLLHALKKVKDNEVQSRLSGKDRFRNVAGVFAVQPNAISKLSGKNILLLDDVLTTGATASECSKMLKKAGAASVFLLTVASTREL